MVLSPIRTLGIRGTFCDIHRPGHGCEFIIVDNISDISPQSHHVPLGTVKALAGKNVKGLLPNFGARGGAPATGSRPAASAGGKGRRYGALVACFDLQTDRRFLNQGFGLFD